MSQKQLSKMLKEAVSSNGQLKTKSTVAQSIIPIQILKKVDSKVNTLLPEISLGGFDNKRKKNYSSKSYNGFAKKKK